MTLVAILSGLRQLLWFLILARIILSFLPNIDSGHPIARFIHSATEPVLAPFRAILPSTRIGIDFSPMLAFFVIDLIFRLVINLTQQMGL
jgi:YggT family protein